MPEHLETTSRGLPPWNKEGLVVAGIVGGALALTLTTIEKQKRLSMGGGEATVVECDPSITATYEEARKRLEINLRDTDAFFAATCEGNAHCPVNSKDPTWKRLNEHMSDSSNLDAACPEKSYALVRRSDGTIITAISSNQPLCEVVGAMTRGLAMGYISGTEEHRVWAEGVKGYAEIVCKQN